ncbi:M48 family metalloprotease [Novosphingobium huizhouense]|uniref:M48 family metalloprotease n=1 Tax=Novosphingobium huizhouense TaxID=2866625 RepID=UPI001CD8FB4F|nr:M48 family metalloprotease [Novosphingobium huizhouense]
MAAIDRAKGYTTHAAEARRHVAFYLAAYVLAFELIGAFALVVPLLMFDEQHTILTDPLGYALRYALPLAALAALVFRHVYRGHAEAVRSALDIRVVDRSAEPRFVTIVEAQCTALGVRFPRFGVIEIDAPNALTVGEGPVRGLIAVTRGLLDRLDDDELAAVLAHEASHIRNGDTRMLAANHALMRTAVQLQVNNPLRLEDWRQMLIPLFLPPFLPILLAGSMATMLSMKLAFAARRGIKLSRDHVADGEAVRVTQYPEALIDALNKVGGRGQFTGSRRIEALLFDGPSDGDGSHPPVAERLHAIATLGKALMMPGRSRRDTRAEQRVRPRFGQRGAAAAAAVPSGAMHFPTDADGRPLTQPPTPTLALQALWFTDRPAYNRWRDATIAWFEWRASDQRNLLGLTPRMLIPLVSVTAFLFVFHWPTDNDPAKFVQTFSPARVVAMFHDVNANPTFCSGPSYPDGTCRQGQTPVYETTRRHGPNHANPWSAKDAPRAAETGDAPPIDAGPMLMFLFLLVLVGLGIFAPHRLKQLVGVVEHKPEKHQAEPQGFFAPSQAPSMPRRNSKADGEDLGTRTLRALVELEAEQKGSAVHSPAPVERPAARPVAEQTPRPAPRPQTPVSPPVRGFGRKQV